MLIGNSFLKTWKLENKSGDSGPNEIEIIATFSSLLLSLLFIIV